MLGVFGSMARGEAREQSDIDRIVRLSKRKSLLEMVKLEREVSTALGRRNDLLTDNSISPYLRDRVRRELMDPSARPHPLKPDRVAEFHCRARSG